MSTKTTMPRSGLFARGNPGIFTLMTALAGLSGLIAAGCEVEPPHDVTNYPHVWYDGRWVYLVDGTWYAPTIQGWIVLRDEPRELGRYRTYYEPTRRRYQPSLPRERGRYRTY